MLSKPFWLWMIASRPNTRLSRASMHRSVLRSSMSSVSTMLSSEPAPIYNGLSTPDYNASSRWVSTSPLCCET